MKINKRTELPISTLICIVFLLLSFFDYQIDKFLGGWFYIITNILQIFAFISIVVYLIKGIVTVYLSWSNLSLKIWFSLIITFLTLFYTLFSPWRLDIEHLESKIEIRACYEGTQNQSVIKFREDHTYERHSTGVFFYSYWQTGNWIKNEDTLFMKYKIDGDIFVNDTIIIRNDYLIPIEQLYSLDSLDNYYRYYYLGFCKGLN